MIIKASRGYVQFSVESKVITVAGEQYNPDGRPGFFVAYIKSLKKWDNGDPVEQQEIGQIKRILEQDFQNKGWNLEWE